MALGHDPDKVAGKALDRQTVGRVWRFASKYRPMLAAFLVAIVVASILDIIPPLIFRRLLDFAIPREDLGSVTALASVAVCIAIASAGSSVLQRWLSARIGEGLIFDLRSALYDHVQRMPLAFFTRTQTGALISRHEQRRHRRPAGVHRHPRRRGAERRSSLVVTLGGDGRPRVAAHPAVARGPARLPPARPSGSGAGCSS